MDVPSVNTHYLDMCSHKIIVLFRNAKLDKKCIQMYIWQL